MVMASCASKLTDQLAGPMDLGSNVHYGSLLSGVGICWGFLLLLLFLVFLDILGCQIKYFIYF